MIRAVITGALLAMCACASQPQGYISTTVEYEVAE